MIELTASEVEACRVLKSYTEKQMAEELYEAISNPNKLEDAQDQAEIEKYMTRVRAMCGRALKHSITIFDILEKAEVWDKDKINKKLKKASPLSLYYLLKDAQGEGKKKVGGRDKEFSDIQTKKDNNIEEYKGKIRELEKLDRDLNSKFNGLLYNIRELKAENKHFDEYIKVLDDNKVEDIDKRLEKLKKIVEDNKADLKSVRNIYKKEEVYISVYVTWLKDSYFNVKKRLDLDIRELYEKIDWQAEYAASLKRQAGFNHVDDLKIKPENDVEELSNIFGKFSPSDCSDVFRLFGTIIEEMADLDEKDWDKIIAKYSADASDDQSKVITPSELRLWTQFQGLLRETTGLTVKHLIPDMDPELARGLTMPEEYRIDDGETFKKICPICNKPPKKTEKVTHYLYKCNNKKCGNTEIFEKKQAGKVECKYCKKGRLKSQRKIIREKCAEHGKELIDGVEQKFQCADCGYIETKVFGPGKHARDKSFDHEGIHYWCDKCKKWRSEQSDAPWAKDVYSGNPERVYCCECDTTLFDPKIKPKIEPKKTGILKPLGSAKPFYKGEDALRSRWRDNWSSGFILKHNSVVRGIDRTFGLPETADISGTTADTIFGIEAMMRIMFTEKLSTYGEKTIPINANRQLSQLFSKWAPLILLPLITMSKHGHHAILECALTLTLTGYIDGYSIGKYTSLWPRGSGGFRVLYKILKKWEDSATNARLIIDRSKDGFVEKGWLLKEKEKVVGKDGTVTSFENISRLDYQRYVDVFLPLRGDIEKKEVGRDYLLKRLKEHHKNLQKLRQRVLKEYCDRKPKKYSKHFKKLFNSYAQKHGVKEAKL